MRNTDMKWASRVKPSSWAMPREREPTEGWAHQSEIDRRLAIISAVRTRRVRGEGKLFREHLHLRLGF